MSQISGIDEKFMSVAIKLADRGVGSVEPNPAVGAVLVKNGRIIGRGWHKEFGGKHAEINAINDALQKGNSPKGATLYVTLEPCCHYGKTPPCTKTIIESKISRVIIACLDPSEKVSGRGVRLLKRAGIAVETGVLSEQAERVNRWFYKFHRERQPWVICKWAQTIDGKLAARSGHSKWISTRESRVQAHKLRRSCQAIVVGVETVNIDNPALTVRNVRATNQPIPVRVVLDTNLRIKISSEIVRSACDIPTYLITSKKSILSKRLKIKRLKESGVEIVVLDTDEKSGRIGLVSFLRFAVENNWSRVLIEGGAKLLSSVLSEKLADELVIFLASKFALDKSARQFHRKSVEKVSDFLSDYRFVESLQLKEDLILRLWRK